VGDEQLPWEDEEELQQPWEDQRTSSRRGRRGAAAGPSRRRRRARAGRVRVHGGEFLPLDEEKMGAVHGWIRL